MPDFIVSTSVWIGAAVLSGMLGNVTYDLFKRGVSRAIAKRKRGGEVNK